MSKVQLGVALGNQRKKIKSKKGKISMSKYNYIAYGSNLNLEQMCGRCPNAVYLGKGYLKNTQLAFRGLGNYSYCTVLRKKGHETPIGIFQIDDNDLIRLDRYEGYPTHYKRKIIKPTQVELTSWLYPDVPLTDSIIYIMNGGKPCIPTDGYFRTVYLGYRCLGLDDRYLFEALDKVSMPPM